MSKINVYSELILRKDSFLATLRELQGEIQGTASKISSTPIEIPVRVRGDMQGALRELEQQISKSPLRIPLEIPVSRPLDAARDAVESWKNKLSGEPLAIPIIAEDRLTPAVRALALELATQPIAIPVIMQPVGGASAAVAAALPGAPAAAGALPAAQAAATGALATAAIAQAVTQPATTPTTPPPQSPSVAAIGGAGAALLSGATPLLQAGGTAPQIANQQGITGTFAASAYGQALAQGRQPLTENSTGVGLRNVFRGLIVARAAYDTAVAGGEAVGLISDYSESKGYSAERLLAREQRIRDAQKVIGRIPIAGEILEGIGAGANRFGSSILNVLHTPGKGGYSSTFESDLGYGERVTEEAKAGDEHALELGREARQRRAEARQIDAAVRRQRFAARMQNASQAERRVQLSSQMERDDLMEELKDERFTDAKGKLTTAGAEYRESRLQEITARTGRGASDVARADTRSQSDLESLKLRNQGQTRAAEAEEFEQKMRDERAKAVEQGPAALQRFISEGYRQASIEFTRQQDQKYGRQDRESAGTVRELQERGTESNLRQQGFPDEASLRARNFAIDERTRKMREAADAETDLTRKTQATAEADAAAAAGDKEKAENLANFKRQKVVDQLTQTAVLRRADAELAREDYTRDQAAFDAAWDTKIAKETDAQQKLNLIAQRAAEQRLRDHQREREAEIRADDTRETRLRAQGHGGEARVDAIRQRVNREVADAGQDVAKKLAIVREERAHLAEDIKQARGPDAAEFTRYARALDAMLARLERQLTGQRRAGTPREVHQEFQDDRQQARVDRDAAVAAGREHLREAHTPTARAAAEKEIRDALAAFRDAMKRIGEEEHAEAKARQQGKPQERQPDIHAPPPILPPLPVGGPTTFTQPAASAPQAPQTPTVATQTKTPGSLFGPGALQHEVVLSGGRSGTPQQDYIQPLPHLALGGIVKKATVALIGESGPEAVVPLSATPPMRDYSDVSPETPEGKRLDEARRALSANVYQKSLDEARQGLYEARRATGTRSAKDIAATREADRVNAARKELEAAHDLGSYTLGGKFHREESAVGGAAQRATDAAREAIASGTLPTGGSPAALPKSNIPPAPSAMIPPGYEWRNGQLVSKSVTPAVATGQPEAQKKFEDAIAAINAGNKPIDPAASAPRATPVPTFKEPDTLAPSVQFRRKEPVALPEKAVRATLTPTAGIDSEHWINASWQSLRGFGFTNKPDNHGPDAGQQKDSDDRIFADASRDLQRGASDFAPAASDFKKVVDDLRRNPIQVIAYQ